jgi:hypothetical protein
MHKRLACIPCHPWAKHLVADDDPNAPLLCQQWCLDYAAACGLDAGNKCANAVPKDEDGEQRAYCFPYT